MSDRYETGMATRRRVLGDAHVDRAEAVKTDADASSDAIPARERSMLTLALLAAMGNWDEIPMHVRACARTGASRTDIMESFQHVAIYCGVPKANHAIKLAKATWAQIEQES